MTTTLRSIGLAMATFVATTVLVLAGGSTARACSCAAVDPLDAVAFAEVVFTGRATENIGTDFEPVWVFDVDGVVKGDLAPSEVVTGQDWMVGCGTDFGRYADSIVVYAARDGDRLRAIGCMPTPSATAFAAMLDAIVEPTGTGPPAAVMVGTYGSTDVAVLDSRARTIARTSVGVGNGVVAHCAGTTLAAAVTSESASVVSIIDLATLSAVEERPIRTDFVSIAGDRVACLDGGARVVAVSGYGPNTGSIGVATSNAPDTGVDDLRRSFEGVSRAVIHPAGTVFLLPTTIGEPLRTLSSTDLEPIGDEVAFPDGTSTLDGDVSPDGSTLAILATVSGQPVEWDTGAKHVLTLELADGLPVAGTTAIVELPTAADDIDSLGGAAKWLRWADSGTWVVEYETVATKRIGFVATDGTEVLAPADVGWGWGLVPLGEGVLRARGGGVEIVGRDGSTAVGDPTPSDFAVDRMLSLARLDDAPPFDVPVTPVERLTITPVDPDAGDPAGVVDPDDDGAGAATNGSDERSDVEQPGDAVTAAAGAGSDGSRAALWVAGGATLLVALLLSGWALRRRASTHRA